MLDRCVKCSFCLVVTGGDVSLSPRQLPFGYRKGPGETIREQDVPEVLEEGGPGYARTKIVSEALLREGSRDGVSTAIFRLPLIIGSDKVPSSAKYSHFLKLLIEAVWKTSSYCEAQIPVATGVDVADAMVSIGTSRFEGTKNFHVVHSEPLRASRLVSILRRMEVVSEEVDVQVWESLARSSVPLLRYYPKGFVGLC